MTLLRAVTAHGTGAAAAPLNHPLGGKTGTTSDYTDAWFLGFSPSVTCGVWVGYDSREPLGEKETGARAALPIWMTWMKAEIASKDGEKFLGDDAEVSPLLMAAKEPGKVDTSHLAIKSGVGQQPGKPVATQPNGSNGEKLVKAGTVKGPAVLSDNGAKVQLPPVKEGATVPPEATAPGKPQTPQASPAAKPGPTVKPALPGRG